MVKRIISVILTGLVVGSSVADTSPGISFSIVNYLSNLLRTDFTDLVNQQSLQYK